MKLALADLMDPRLSPLIEETRAFYAKRPAGRGPSSLEELRAARAQRAAPSPTNPPADEILLDGSGHLVPLRIHTPIGTPAMAVVLDIHGGGFYMGSAADGDLRNRQLSDALGVVVVSVDYRLAPEHPWPAAPDDCEVAAIWLAEHAHERFGTTKLVICGFSAGATLAITTLIRLRNRGISNVDGAVLQFGTYDLSGRTPAGGLIAQEYFLDAYVGGLVTGPIRTSPQSMPTSKAYPQSC